VLAGDNRRVRHTSKAIDVFDGDRINLVVHVEALDVLAVAFNHVNEVIGRRVLTEKHLAIVDPVLVEDLVDRLGRIVTELQRFINVKMPFP
jgi:hypothetical protein